MKPVFVISCPIDTYSGYGARSRDIVKAIIETDKYDVKILPQRWGATSWGFIDDHTEWSFLKAHILEDPRLPKQPEIWAQITIPNEFQPIGKYNIGITAGIETDATHGSWIEGCNRMNLVITSSDFAKKTFEAMTYTVADQNGIPQGSLQLTTPIEVIFEGANTDIYKVIEAHQVKNIDLSSIKEDFCYLFVGHWMQGDFGEDRKNVGLLVKAFYETFKNKSKKPALILKASGGVASYMDRDELLKRIEIIKQSVNSVNLPNVYLLHGEFSDEEMNELYNHPKVKAMVSLTKGEGFGRPLLEFSLVKKPIMTTNWSAHTEFLSSEFNALMSGELRELHSSVINDWFIKEAKWFNVNPGEVGHYLKDMFENYKPYKEKANRQAFRSRNQFSWEKMAEKVDQILTERIPEFPKEVELKLPELKKIELPKLKKVE
jgi:glycosyltransferase involved in cell wall biosynthesis